jgi:hypothetical protein
MNYTKPEVNVLGQAVRVIENSLDKSVHNFTDVQGPKRAIQPAYDLDE